MRISVHWISPDKPNLVLTCCNNQILGHKMIVIKLECNFGHSFEGWFKSSDEIVRQKDQDMIGCPVCGSNQLINTVTKESISTSNSFEDGNRSEVNYQEIKMISDQFGNEFRVGSAEDINFSNFQFSEYITQLKSDLTQTEVKDLNEDGVSSLLRIAKEKLN